MSKSQVRETYNNSTSIEVESHLKLTQKLEDQIEYLLEALEQTQHPTVRVMWKNFIRGMAFGLGTTLGVSIVVAIITFALTQLKAVPLLDQIIIQTQVEEILPQQ